MSRKRWQLLLFFGLNGPIHGKLESILQAQGHRVFHAEAGASHTPNAIFCDGDGAQYPRIFSRIRASLPGLPLIVVTQNPSEGKWLDAIEAGAADYCSTPFEPIQVRWILDAVLKHALPIPYAA